jgi:RNA polymerase sigma factor (TIGR02999 family)
MLAPLQEASRLHLDSFIQSADGGDEAAREHLFAALYDELHRSARRELRRHDALTIGATTLLHETYLSIARRNGLEFADRASFMAYAARAMRGLVIDYARSRRAQKRGAGFELTSLPTEIPENIADAVELELLGDAVEELARVDPALAQLVDLKFFCGLSFVDIAALRSVSERTVQRDWEKARILLFRALQRSRVDCPTAR